MVYVARARRVFGGWGGAISLYGATGVFVDCNFTQNTAQVRPRHPVCMIVETAQRVDSSGARLQRRPSGPPCPVRRCCYGLTAVGGERAARRRGAAPRRPARGGHGHFRGLRVRS